MTPAAAAALMKGDMENFKVASTPGGIEAQEKAGQIEQSFALTMPIELKPDKATYEALGFVFGKELDDVFQEAQLPEGWRKSATAHSMWTDLLDDHGRVRGAIFYKAAFYDRHAHAHLERRFSVKDDHGRDDDWNDLPTRTVYVQDACGAVERKITGLSREDWSNREAAQEAYAKVMSAENCLRQWLSENWPDWESVTAYWEASV